MGQDWRRPERLDEFAGVHPRYLLTKSLLADLKGKTDTTHKKMREIVKERAESYTAKSPPSDYNKQQPMRIAGRDIPWMALAYLLSGDTVHLVNAKRWILSLCTYPTWDGDRSLGAGECLFGVSIGYDWLYDKFTKEEREFIRAKLVYQAEAMKKDPQHHNRWLANHNHVEHNGLAAAGFVLYDEVPQVIDWIRQADMVFRQMFKLRSSDGSSDEGHQYWAYSTESILCYMQAARDLMGIDYYDNEWVKHIADFIIFSTIPDFNSTNYVMSYGDTGRDYGPRNPVYILYRLGSEYNNGYAQQLADEMFEEGIGMQDYKSWCNLLWYDENVRPMCLPDLDTFKHFDDIGWITTRSGWDKDAVMIGFKCGPFHGHKLQPYYERQVDLGWPFQKISGGHCHPDISSFQIYAYGRWLAIDPGHERPKWTKNHNTILINGTGQLGEGTTWFNREDVVSAKASSRIIKSQNEKEYDYIIGDAGNIYPQASGMKKFLRHLLYIKPDVVLIIDELEAEQPAQFEWRLHAEESINKISNQYCIVKNGDVAMDARFVLPEAVDVKIQGKFLTALPERTNKTVVAVVLHPRKIKSKVCEARIVSFRDSVIDMRIRSSKKEISVKIDLVKQKVYLQ